jgi:hypothetical protein
LNGPWVENTKMSIYNWGASILLLHPPGSFGVPRKRQCHTCIEQKGHVIKLKLSKTLKISGTPGMVINISLICQLARLEHLTANLIKVQYHS